jgi:hypothetical protein
VVSVQLAHRLHAAVVLIIRRSWVRAPPAPPAQLDSDVTVAQLLDQYVATAGWDVSTRESILGYIRRTIKPALRSTQVRKVRGPLLDTLYGPADAMRQPRVHRQAIHRAPQHPGPAA